MGITTPTLDKLCAWAVKWAIPPTPPQPQVPTNASVSQTHIRACLYQSKCSYEIHNARLNGEVTSLATCYALVRPVQIQPQTRWEQSSLIIHRHHLRCILIHPQQSSCIHLQQSSCIHPQQSSCIHPQQSSCIHPQQSSATCHCKPIMSSTAHLAVLNMFTISLRTSGWMNECIADEWQSTAGSPRMKEGAYADDRCSIKQDEKRYNSGFSDIARTYACAEIAHLLIWCIIRAWEVWGYRSRIFQVLMMHQLG